VPEKSKVVADQTGGERGRLSVEKPFWQQRDQEKSQGAGPTFFLQAKKQIAGGMVRKMRGGTNSLMMA